MGGGLANSIKMTKSFMFSFQHSKKVSFIVDHTPPKVDSKNVAKTEVRVSAEIKGFFCTRHILQDIFYH